jgi:hypothetical protein
MRKTIAVAELLYFQPVGPLPGFTTSMHVKVDMERYHAPVDFGVGHMGFITGAAEESSGSTAQRQRQPSAGGGGTRHADADYWRHMLSGRGRLQPLLWSSSLIASACWKTLN